MSDDNLDEMKARLRDISENGLRQDGEECTFLISVCDTLDRITELERQNAQQVAPEEWISTDAEKPEEDEVVIATGPLHNDYSKGRFTCMARFSYGTFYQEETGDDIYWPSHFMRIPALPAAPHQQSDEKGAE